MMQRCEGCTELHMVLQFFFHNGPARVCDMIASGWPVFGLLGKLERQAIDYYGHLERRGGCGGSVIA